MHIRPLSVFAAAAVLAGLLAYGMGVVQAACQAGLGWESLSRAWPFILAGGLGGAMVLGGFVWLALYSPGQGCDAGGDPHRR